MTINDTNITAYNARVLSYDIVPAKSTARTDWQQQQLDFVDYGSKDTYKEITVLFLIKDTNRDACEKDKSNICSALKSATIKFSDCDLYFKCVYDSSSDEYIKNTRLRVTVKLKSSFAYLPAVTTNITGTSGTINVAGNEQTPAIVTLTPSQDIGSISLSGFTEKQIVVNNLRANCPIKIDGESCIVSEPDIAASLTETSGLNKWIFRKFSMASMLDPDVMRIWITPAKDMITSNNTYIQSLLSDATDIYHNQGGNDYLGYLKTAVSSSTAKTITLNFCHDDGVNVYFDGVSKYSKDYPENNGGWPGKASVSLSLTANTWHIIEILWIQHFGDDGIWNFANTVSSQVGSLNAYYARENPPSGTVNKFPDCELWEFPYLKPGANTITINNANCAISVQHKPKYM